MRKFYTVKDIIDLVGAADVHSVEQRGKWVAIICTNFTIKILSF